VGGGGARECKLYYLGQPGEDRLHDGEAGADDAEVDFKDGEDERYPGVAGEVGLLEVEV